MLELKLIQVSKHGPRSPLSHDLNTTVSYIIFKFLPDQTLYVHGVTMNFLIDYDLLLVAISIEHMKV